MKYALSIFILLTLISCKDERDVRYEVSCQSCDLTYSNKEDNTEQREVSGPWEYNFEAEPNHFLYISAQNNRQSGTVAVKIYWNDELLESASSSGAFVIATASASAP